MVNQENLLNVAKELLALNPGTLLSGSISLQLQGFKARREPKDIDIFLPHMQSIKLLPRMRLRSTVEEDEYDDEYFERSGYNIDGINIDIFTPIDQSTNMISVKMLHGIDAVPCVMFFEILKMKICHSYGDHFSRFKHKDDIVFMMSLIS